MNSATETRSAPKTSPTTRAFILALSHPRLSELTNEQEIKNRLVGLGYTEACGRCCGTGSFGPLSVLGGKCFQCNGRSTIAPRLTRTLLDKVRAEVSDATLNAYADSLIARKRARIEARKARERVAAGYSQTVFMRHFYERDGKGVAREDIAFSPLSRAIHDNEKAHDEAFQAASFLLTRGEVEAEEVLRLEAAIVRARRIQDIAIMAALASGEIDDDARRYAEAKASGSYDAERACYRAAFERAAVLLAEVEATLVG